MYWEEIRLYLITRVQEILLDGLESLGLEKSKFGLHSLRSGGAAGINDRVFKKHGRWASDTAKDGYVHESITENCLFPKTLVYNLIISSAFFVNVESMLL